MLGCKLPAWLGWLAGQAGLARLAGLAGLAGEARLGWQARLDNSDM